MADTNAETLLAVARKTPANLRYFFERLEDPAWIPTLEREWFFADPPAVERTTDDEGTWVRFPEWPASRYLVRVAAADPQTVARVMLTLTDTDNVRVHEDVVTAALSMPGELAAELARKECQWFERAAGPMLNYAVKLIDLGAYLLSQGHPDEATAIFDSVLRLERADSPTSSRRRASSRLSEWQYGQALEKIGAAWLEYDRQGALRWVGHLLATAVELSMREGGQDLSHMWRAAVESHTQNLGHSVFDEVVDATRDWVEAAAQSEEGARQALEALSKFEGPIFRRLQLHVLRVAGDLLPEQAAAALLDLSNLEDTDVWHEYSVLLRARFESLTEDQQSRLLAAIREGASDESEDPPERVEARRELRRFKRLALIENELDETALADYERLKTRFGAPEHPDFLAVSTSWVGPTAPLSVEQVHELSPSELVAYLASWEPETTFGPGPSREGLNRILAQAVGERPEPFATEAALFAGSDPTYVRGLVDGFAEAVKRGRAISWGPVLELAAWVVSQPVQEQPDALDMERDPGWEWSRKSVASLLSRGFENVEAGLPIEQREVAWALLADLAEDPEPRPDQESDDHGMDPATRSLNVTRGEAMHAVVRYVMWVERLLGEEFDGLSVVPEAKALLERHLDPAIDPSPAVRAVYGMWLAQLVRIDKQWVAEQAPQLFPTEAALARLFLACWNAYVVFTRPWLGVLTVIEPAYCTAVEHLEAGSEPSALTDRPDEKLGEHLVWYAVMGAIPVEEPGLWQEYWNASSIHLRRHAVEHLARMFEQAQDAPEEVLHAAQRLWGWIVANVEGTEDRRSILRPFGWMLRAKIFDGGWLLTQALSLLEQGVHLEADFAVWEGLQRLVPDYPAESAGVLILMVRTDPDGLAALGYEESITEVLRAALNSDSPDAQRRAKDAIDLLIARGLHTYRELLS